jgi:hypothetical protein
VVYAFAETLAITRSEYSLSGMSLRLFGAHTKGLPFLRSITERMPDAQELLTGYQDLCGVTIR